jgi:hypothetical protein
VLQQYDKHLANRRLKAVRVDLASQDAKKIGVLGKRLCPRLIGPQHLFW